MSLKLNTSQVGLTSLLKEGIKHHQGIDEAVLRNIGAAKALADITRTSFGPAALNKLVINALDKTFLTSDAGTIMRELEVQHPAARLLLMASQQQGREAGEGTNLVVLLAGELLASAERLLRIGIKPALIIEGYELAYKKALGVLDDLVLPSSDAPVAAAGTSALSIDHLRHILLPVLGARQHGWESTLTNFVIDAIRIVMGTTGDEKLVLQGRDETSGPVFNPDNVRCVKLLGGSLPMSMVIPGLLLEREPLGRVRSVANAKVAVYACPLNTSRTETKGTVLIKGAQDLLTFSQGEEAILEEQIRSVAESGVTVVVTGETIGELAMHYIETHGMLALKIPSKFDLRRLCKATGATPLARLGPPTEEEAGWADRVDTIEVGGTICTVFKQTPAHQHRSRLATVILRGATAAGLDDVERAIEGALATVRSLGKDSRLVPGAGATEIEIARQVAAWGETVPGIAQHAIRAYAESFEAIPRVLAMNGGLDGTQVVAKLYWAHGQGQTRTGVLLDGGSVDSDDYLEVGETEEVMDLLVSKRSAIHLATEAALTVLRVDQIIESKPVAGPKARSAGPQDADD